MEQGYNESDEMDVDSLAYLDKAIKSLAGAESEYANRRYNNCANRCYHAMGA